VIDDLGLKEAYVITPGNDSYPIDKQVKCSNLINFLTEILPAL
jgi:hypothetical protein